MSPKELLYIEDTLSHLKFMRDKCNYAKTQVSDASLKKLIEKVSKKNQKMLDTLYALVATEEGGN